MATVIISTHAPLARCDEKIRTAYELKSISTHAPLARCDTDGEIIRMLKQISTHAPLARCDENHRRGSENHLNFNSRTSCEVRRNPVLQHCTRKEFQLTHLLRGATSGDRAEILQQRISTHAPLARCDSKIPAIAPATAISTHAPLARCDVPCACGCGTMIISTHAPLARCDTSIWTTGCGASNFNSRTSCEVRRKRRLWAGALCEFQLTHLLRGATLPVVQ